jgi:hypothetical protein
VSSSESKRKKPTSTDVVVGRNGRRCPSDFFANRYGFVLGAVQIKHRGIKRSGKSYTTKNLGNYSMKSDERITQRRAVNRFC